MISFIGASISTGIDSPPLFKYLSRFLTPKRKVKVSGGNFYFPRELSHFSFNFKLGPQAGNFSFNFALT
jgi:hypothetical protein